MLRSVLRSHPPLRRFLKHCRHCRIFFLAHPRNAGRKDLHCPFGCREANRKRESTRRSGEYYRTSGGKIKKKIQNGKRRRKEKAPDSQEEETRASADEWNGQILEHVRMVASWIERRRVSLDEIVKMLRRVVRQRSIGGRRRIDYIVAHLNKAPP